VAGVRHPPKLPPPDGIGEWGAQKQGMRVEFQKSTFRNILLSLARWFDSYAGTEEMASAPEKKVDFLRVLPFVLLHVSCLGIYWVGWSPVAVGTAAGLYLIRMFAITAFYHRYFSHNAFRASRAWAFAFAVLGSASAQRGPLWWAGHHRHHHLFPDTEGDIHSPLCHGFWWSHIGWITSTRNFPTRRDLIGDFDAFPELRFLDRFDILVPALLAAGLYTGGGLLSRFSPELGTSGPQMLVWGFFVSTTVLFHATSTINSLSHLFGSRRYDTGDGSRNNVWLAFLTLGEGWHNNHHRYAVSARQGFFWWEVDLTYYGLVVLSWLGIVRDLRPVPEAMRRPEAVPT
jgi:stearoyl-CoA desaturase (delta-9 desaturase)